MNRNHSWVLGACFIIGLSTASLLLDQQLKAMERIVQVKGRTGCKCRYRDLTS